MLKIFISMLLLITALFGVQANPALQGFTQTDGTEFKGHLKGDEHLNWIETQDGMVLLFNKTTKNYSYAKIENNNLKASTQTYHSPSHTKSSSNKIVPNITQEELQNLWQAAHSQPHQHQ